MNIKLLDKYINDFFYQYDDNNDDNNNDNDDKKEKKETIKVMKTENVISLNEIKICHKIEGIKNYSTHFHIVKYCRDLSVGEYDSLGHIIKLNEHPNIKHKYTIFYYERNDMPKFQEILRINNCKIMLMSLLQSFFSLLSDLILLKNNEIIMFDISPDKILFDREKTMLKGFEKSIDISSLNIKKFVEIMHFMDDYTYKPLEIYLLYYLIKKNIVISYSNADAILENYILNLERNKITKMFSRNYLNDYKEKCRNEIKKYINKSVNVVIKEIMEYCYYWDVYSVSLIYLYVFGHIVHVFDLKNTFLNKLIIKLSNNLTPISLERDELEELLSDSNMLMEKYNDWSFVNKMDNGKLTILLNLLED